ncbi:glycosyltransferase family 2 protein [Sphingomonas sanxanigenens]|uniref:Glycosyltransferase 2-like domain-containing protein n=1 Tax=Sphingomonas sanxanigenens DSM 19645 = NX02 TaxID=1123269 RepID=W0AFH0_9SPHN|nr:glycosyltransferase family 2 protein [Sphingomonas sanxanigenens]AHE55008.1 hypothetical protein NX02_16650 [Sphingomonas sanxanigenens DSM 19645 = NX02]
MMLLFVWLLCLIVALPVAVLAIECVTGAWARARAIAPAVGAPAFTVLMPAHDEAAGIAGPVRAVLAQLRPQDRLIVIADNCTDETAAIARGLGATVIERTDPERRGKGCALEFGRAHLSAGADTVVVIVDADCEPEPLALQRLAETAGRCHAVVQGAYLMLPPDDATAIVRVSCFAFLIKNLVRQRALAALAGAALLQGSGMAFPRELFRRIEWRPDSLVEDLDMGLDLLLEGEKVLFEETARFTSAASSQRGTEGQRRRWEHGMLHSMAVYVPRLLRAGLLMVALDLMVPPTVLLIGIAGLATFAALLLAGFSTPVLLLIGLELMLAIGLIGAWHAHGRALLPARSLAQLPAYLLWKLPIIAQFATRRQKQWIRTERKP